MTASVSLQTRIVLAFILLCTILVLGYSFLSAHFFSRGIDSVISEHMEIMVQRYLKSIPMEQRNNVVTIGASRISNQWKFMPKIVQQLSPHPPQPTEMVRIVDDAHLFVVPKIAYFVKAVEESGEIFYISQSVSLAKRPSLIGWNSLENIRYLLVLACAIGGALAIFIWCILRQISIPVSLLHTWAKGLGKDTLEKDLPDFHYKELNELAVIVKNSVLSLYISIEKEKQFLGYASHELRSPITVLTQNVEFMRAKYAKSRTLQPDNKRILERMERASLDMKYIVETLLWLNKDTSRSLPCEHFCLSELILQVVEDDRYLLEGKHVLVQCDCLPYSLFECRVPLRIVLSNLIRNAFTYTSEGAVYIQQQEGKVTILNDDTSGSESIEEMGFGLGLRLVKQISRDLDWEYFNTYTESGRKVALNVKK